MKDKILLVLFLSVLTALISCSTTKKSSKGVHKTLTQQQAVQEADYFAQGVIQREAGNIDKALEFFTKALNIDPEDPAALYEKSRILSASGKFTEAYALAKKAVIINPENRWYKSNYANIARQEGKYDEYLKAYEELVQQYPEDFDLINELAYAYVYTGEYTKAISEYNKVENQVGINEPLINQKVKLYSQIGDYQNGVKEFEKLIAQNPEETRYYAMLAEYCAKNKMDDKAIWAYEQIEKLNPDDPYVHISLADFYRQRNELKKSFDELKLGMANKSLDIQTKVQLLSTYYSGTLDEEQKTQALELSEILIKTHPGNPIAKTLYASMLYHNTEYKKARKLTSEILQTDSLNYAVWEQLLFCDMYLNNYNNLATEANQVIDLFPNQPLPYLMSGIANYQLKKFQKAADILETGKDFVAGNNALLEEFYNYLGEIYYKLENYEACYQAYDKVLSLNPKNSIVLNNYAYYLSLQKINLQKAERMARHAVNLDQKNSNNLDTYAWVLYQLGKYDEALKWQGKALENGGNTSGTVLKHYAKILNKLGREEESKKYYEMAKKYKE